MSIQDSNSSVVVPTMDDVRKAIKEAIEEHAASRNHPYATQVEPGFVTLSNETDSDSETTVATSKAVKKAYELANTANQNAINSHMGGSSLPVGVPVPWPTEIPPEGWLICNGDSFDTVKYPKLALAYPSGILPDLRGEFIRGWDNERGVDTPRKILSWQEGSYLVQEMYNPPDRVVNFSLDERKDLNWDIPDTEVIKLRGKAVTADKSGTWSIDKRYLGVTRPRNIAFNYIVRAA
ncbi:phage tail protein [Xenorhabdus bovienii]|uniref:phage tail protein n=1 Tax=Xenorhabdus bovienii TaxID=40576 RepID=UPI0023B2438A|nr:phage tail protein [Xenorhabdus bovienii]MDE9538161.1 phage tail protein [Xenorhabdus bovienii]